MGLLSCRFQLSQIFRSSGTICGKAQGTFTTGILIRNPPNLEWEKIIDENYEELIYTFNEDKIQEYYNNFQKTLIDEMVIIPIFRKYTFMAVRNKWGNINWGFGYSIGDSYRRIYLKNE